VFHPSSVHRLIQTSSMVSQSKCARSKSRRSRQEGDSKLRLAGLVGEEGPEAAVRARLEGGQGSPRLLARAVRAGASLARVLQASNINSSGVRDKARRRLRVLGQRVKQAIVCQQRHEAVSGCGSSAETLRA